MLPKLTISVRYEGDTSGDYVYSVERDADGKFYDFGSQTFVVGTPDTPTAPLVPLNRPWMRAVYTNDSLYANNNEFPPGLYITYIIDNDDDGRVVKTIAWMVPVQTDPHNVTINFPGKLVVQGEVNLDGCDKQN